MTKPGSQQPKQSLRDMSQICGYHNFANGCHAALFSGQRLEIWTHAPYPLQMGPVLVKTVILVAMLSACLALPASAFQTGFEAGPVFQYMNTVADPHADNPVISDALYYNLTQGIWIKKRFNGRISLLAELNYVRKGEIVTDDVYKDNMMLFGNYIELPLLFCYSLSDNLEIMAGPSFAYIISSVLSDNSTETIADNAGPAHTTISDRIDFSAALRAKFLVSDRFFTDLRFDYGLMYKIKENTHFEETEINSRTLSVSAGYQF